MSWNDGRDGKYHYYFNTQTSSELATRCAMALTLLLLDASESSRRSNTRFTDICKSLDRITKAAEEMSQATGRTCIPAQADVRNPKALRDAVAKTIEKFGRIDFVICGTSP